jgi:Ca-activated chloride channel family protein
LPRFEQSAHLLFLLLLPVMVLFFLSLLRWRSDVVRRIGDESLVRSMIGGDPLRGAWFRFSLIASAFALAVLGLANMQTPREAATEQRKGVDVMFALDVSRSMYADDVKPSRLQVAKQLLARIMERMPDARIGLVLFAGRSYLQMPLTFDRASASAFLAAAGPESVPSQGTAIAESLTMAAMALSTDQKSQKVLFMVTDGEDHEEGIAEAAVLIRESGIHLMVAGVGTEAGVALKDPESGLVRLDFQGNPVVTRLNEEFLRSLAKEAGGLYLGSSETDGVVKGLLDRVDAMEKTPLAAPSEARYHSHFPWFLGAALLLLLFEYLYRDKSAKV